MYTEILQGLIKKNKITSEDLKISYLRSLHATVIDLWNSYRKNYFYLDYKHCKIQEAYMLRYFPSYSELVYLELKAKSDLIKFHDNNINCILFGSGPCPEAYGIIKFINEYQKERRNINFVSLDKVAEHWEATRSITINELIPCINKDNKFRINSWKYDLTIPIKTYNKESLKSFNTLIGKSNLIIFQNFLNEINLKINGTNVYQNIVHIYNNLPKGSIIIFIEVSGYDIQVCDLLMKIQREIQKLNPIHLIEPFCSSDPIYAQYRLAPPSNTKHFNATNLNSEIPEILKECFFNNTLFPKIKIDYDSLILRR